MTAVQAARVVDYFAVISYGDQLEPVAEPHTTTTPRSFIDRVYKAQVTFRYPQQDLVHAPFPPGASLFCMSDDLRLSTAESMPKFYYFASTTADGVRMYGACLKFYESLPADIVLALSESDRREQSHMDERAPVNASNRSSVAAHHTTDSGHEYDVVDVSVSMSEEERREVEMEEEMEREHAHRLITAALSQTDGDGGDDARQSSNQRTSPSKSLSPARPSIERVTSSQRSDRKIFAPKCLAVLSVHPFLAQFREFLTELYRISLTPMPVPLERFIANFMCDVPLPPMGELKVAYEIAGKHILFYRAPPNNPLACLHFPLRLMFECLSLENALLLIESVLMEKRILLVSTKLSALTVVAETLLHLIFPFVWPHVYIPLLPKALLDFLFTPFPFVIGVHASYIKGQLHGDMLNDLVQVDLDKNVVIIHSGRTHRQFPPRERKKLKKSLGALNLYKSERTIYEQKLMESMDDAFTHAPSPDDIEALMAQMELEEAAAEQRKMKESSPTEQLSPSPHHGGTQSAVSLSAINQELFISHEFFRAFVSLFKDYRAYLIQPTTTNPFPDPCFNQSAFLRHHDHQSATFLRDLLTTQAFTSFIEERIYPTSDPASHARVLFFDESIIAKKNRSKFVKKIETPFLDSRKYELTETYTAPGPDATGTKSELRYDNWPPLNIALFPVPRKLPLSLSKKGLLSLPLPPPATAESAVTRRLNAATSHSSLEQVIYTVWFTLLTSIATDFKLTALLSVAFRVLYDLRLGDVRPEEEVFIRLMRACGSCGVPERAVEIIEIMNASGYTPDAAVMNHLLQIFSSTGDYKGYEALINLREMAPQVKRKPAANTRVFDHSAARLLPSISTEDSESRSSNKRSPSSSTRALSPNSGFDKKDDDDDNDAVESAKLQPPLMSPPPTSPPALSPNHSLETTATAAQAETDGVDDAEALLPAEDDDVEPNALERPNADDVAAFHRQFAHAFPNFTVDTTNVCDVDECRSVIGEADIRRGWTMRAADYTTECPKCGERFAAQMIINKRTDEAAQTTKELAARNGGDGESKDHATRLAEQYALQQELQATQYRQLNAQLIVVGEKFPLVVPYLPPRALKKELCKVLDERGASFICHPDFRLHSAPLYWNLCWHLTSLALPVHTLLVDWSSQRALPDMTHQMRFTSPRPSVSHTRTQSLRPTSSVSVSVTVLSPSTAASSTLNALSEEPSPIKHIRVNSESTNRLTTTL